MLPKFPYRNGRSEWPLGGLAGLTALAVAVHGYHLGADDAAIYIPAIKRVADPGLYPFGAEFFLAHARLSLFPNLVGGSARLAHVPVDYVIFAWHVIGILLLFAAGWQLLGLCFTRPAARWCGVAMLAAVLTAPVTGTGLAIMDPYLTARSLSTPATLFAIACYFSGRRYAAAGWLALTAAVHPQMAVYGVVFLGLVAILRRAAARQPEAAPVAVVASILPFTLSFAPVTGAARACLLSRSYFFVSNWAWYEWIGVFAPLLLLAWWHKASPRNTLPAFRELAGALVPFGLLATAAALALGASPRLESYNRLQPMRGFQVVYIVFFLLLGGLLGEYVLRAHPFRWAALFVPAALLMVFVNAATYPASRHVEWPGTASGNSWVSAFLWIRTHTPKTAVFAVDPDYMARPGEDEHGFRAVAERSVLADEVKDSGAVSLFPQLAPEWSREVSAARGFNDFHIADFRRLAAEYPVTWILTARPAPASLSCPYQNHDLAVCKL